MNDNVIGKALAEYFKSQGITQSEVAKRLGVSQPCIGQLFSGKNSFGKNNARKWANEFGFNASFLITGEGALFPVDEISIMNGVASDITKGTSPESAEYWKSKYEECNKELQRANGIIEGLRMALGVHVEKSNVG